MFLGILKNLFLSFFNDNFSVRDMFIVVAAKNSQKL